MKELKPSTHLDINPKSEPALWLHSRAAPRVEAHPRSVGPNTGSNSEGRWIIKKNFNFGTMNAEKYFKKLNIVKADVVFKR